MDETHDIYFRTLHLLISINTFTYYNSEGPALSLPGCAQIKNDLAYLSWQVIEMI